MAEGLRRTDLQRLAEAKIADAQLLLANRRFSNAFYLAGYAAEIGLKACIARRMMPETIPDLALIKATYVHQIGQLVGVAGLSGKLKEEQSGNPTFAAYWGIVGQWSEASRYEFTEQMSAQLMVQAVDDSNSGILRWIRQHW